MLEGKFICTESVVEESMIFNKVYDFLNGACKFENGEFSCPVKTIKEFNEYYRLKIEPYKEYLTIDDLVDDTVYMLKGEEFNYKIMYREGTINIEGPAEGWIPRYHSYKRYKEMKFLEINPNQERIEEVKALIEEKGKDAVKLRTSLTQRYSEISKLEGEYKLLTEHYKK